MGAAVDIKADDLAFVDETIGVELQISLAMGFLDQNWVGELFWSKLANGIFVDMRTMFRD